MKISLVRNSAFARLFVVVAMLIVGEVGYSEEFPFRVAYERVPGAQQVESGDLETGVAILRQELDGAEGELRGRILSTLCAAFTVARSFSNARPVCDEAVSETGSETAYNNRGVYRALTGNWHGARADFERARPGGIELYMEELRQRDVGLVASGNFELIEILQARHSAAEIVQNGHDGLVAVETIEN